MEISGRYLEEFKGKLGRIVRIALNEVQKRCMDDHTQMNFHLRELPILSAKKIHDHQ